MKISTQWLNEAKKLCDEIGPEDGVDPRLLVRAHRTKNKSHKTMQLCKEAKHTLSLVIAGELSDAALQNLEVADVAPNADGQYLWVTLYHRDIGVLADERYIEEKLLAIQGYLRAAVAQSIKRKRVPALKFKLVRAQQEVNENAYSKSH